MCGQGDGAPRWSVAVHWVCRPYGFLGGTGQGWPSSVFYLGPPCLSYNTSEMAATCVGLEIPRRSQGVKLSWLLLVMG